MNENIKEIQDILKDIEYGYLNSNKKNIFNFNHKEKTHAFTTIYKLQTEEELLKSKCGICWDQVELQRKLLNERNIENETYFICIYNDKALPAHTFITYKLNNKYYWFEHAWEKYNDIHEYNTKEEMLLDIKDKFIKDHPKTKDTKYTFIYKYNKPNKQFTVNEYYKYIETQTLIKLNKEEYYFIALNKDFKENNKNEYIYLYKDIETLQKSLKNTSNDYKIYKININDEELLKNTKDIIEKNNLIKIKLINNDITKYIK